MSVVLCLPFYDTPCLKILNFLNFQSIALLFPLLLLPPLLCVFSRNFQKTDFSFWLLIISLTGLNDPGCVWLEKCLLITLFLIKTVLCKLKWPRVHCFFSPPVSLSRSHSNYPSRRTGINWLTVLLSCLLCLLRFPTVDMRHACALCVHTRVVYVGRVCRCCGLWVPFCVLHINLSLCPCGCTNSSLFVPKLAAAFICVCVFLFASVAVTVCFVSVPRR